MLDVIVRRSLRTALLLAPLAAGGCASITERFLQEGRDHRRVEAVFLRKAAGP